MQAQVRLFYCKHLTALLVFCAHTFDRLDMLPNWCAHICMLPGRNAVHLGILLMRKVIIKKQTQMKKKKKVKLVAGCDDVSAPLQNACGAGQGQARVAGKRTSAFQRNFRDLAKRCRQRVHGSDDEFAETDNFPGMLLLSTTATSATGDLDACQPVYTLHSGRAL